MLRNFFSSLLRRTSRNGRDRSNVMTEAATVAVLSAHYLVREPDEDGPRVIVMSSMLGGSFRFSVEEADRRIRSYFPSISEREVRQLTQLMVGKVRINLLPAPKEKTGWVRGWSDC